MKNYEVDKMVKKKVVKGVPAEQIGEANHIMRLVSTITAKIQNSYLNVDQRKTMNQLFGFIKERIKIMEDNDEEFQNRPENRVDSLKAELKANDERLKRNKEEHTVMVQIGLIQKKAYPETGLIYDKFLETTEFGLANMKMKIDSGYKVLNPQYEFQKTPGWVNLQLENCKKQYSAAKKGYDEIKQYIEEVENDITAQNERMKNRRVQIIEELKKLGVKDIPEEKKKQNYIG